MAREDSKPTAPTSEAPAEAAAPLMGFTQEQMMQLLLNNNLMAQAMMKIAEQSENGPIRQIPISKIKVRTPWNPEGVPEHERPELSRVTYLNGFRLRELLLSSTEIELLNQVRAGKYNGKRWTVIVKEAESEGSGSECIIYLPNKSQGDRIVLAQASVHPTDPTRNGLTAILDRIVAEQSTIKLA